MRKRAILGVCAGGLVAAFGIAAWRAIPASDAVELVAVSVVAAGVLFALAWWWLSRRSVSIAAQTVTIVVVSTLATAIGTLAAARAMFVSSHDLAALSVVAVSSTACAVAGALWLGRSAAHRTHELESIARSIERDGGGAVEHRGAHPAEPAELASLRAELGAISERLAEANERELQLEQGRRNLVTWISHDLRTPLTGITAMIEALEDGVVTEPADIAAYHRRIGTEVGRLGELINDLFVLSRIDSSAVAAHRDHVSIDDLVNDVVATSEPAAQAANVSIRSRPSGSSAILELSSSEIDRAVRNLIDNAIRHTQPGGTVDISVHSDDHGVEIRVADACGGIPADELPHIFEPAYRGDSARTSGDGGGGLGLTIARGLVEAHGGIISVGNTEHGCCFTVQLPPIAETTR